MSCSRCGAGSRSTSTARSSRFPRRTRKSPTSSCGSRSSPRRAPSASPTGRWSATRYNLGVAQASLDISRQTLRDNRTRVEVGTMAPIDVVGAEAEVARNEEAAIVAASQIDAAEDQLRALIFDPKLPEFWTMDLELADAPQLPQTRADVDVEGAVKAALEKRTDLIQLRKQLEISQINLDLAEEQHEAAAQRRGQLRAERPRRRAGDGAGRARSEQPVRPRPDPRDHVEGLRQRARRSGRLRLSDLDARRAVPLPARQQHPEGQRGAAAAGLHGVGAEPAQRRTERGERSAGRGPQRQHQPQARRVDDLGAGLLGAAARRRAEEVRGRPGPEHRRPDRPARPGDGPVQRAELDHRLRQVARRFRDGAGRRHRRRPPGRGRPAATVRAPGGHTMRACSRHA